MAVEYEIVNIGSAPNAKDGDTARAAFKKVNNNFELLFGSFYASNEEKNADFNAEGQVTYLVSTSSSSVTATLPANPPVGTIIRFVDAAGRFSLNPFYVNPNGNRIKGQETPGLMYNESYAFTDFFFAGAITGWIVR